MSDDLNKAKACAAMIIADQGLIIKKCNQKISSQESRIKELEEKIKALELEQVRHIEILTEEFKRNLEAKE